MFLKHFVHGEHVLFGLCFLSRQGVRTSGKSENLHQFFSCCVSASHSSLAISGSSFYFRDKLFLAFRRYWISSWGLLRYRFLFGVFRVSYWLKVTCKMSLSGILACYIIATIIKRCCWRMFFLDSYAWLSWLSHFIRHLFRWLIRCKIGIYLFNNCIGLLKNRLSLNMRKLYFLLFGSDRLLSLLNYAWFSFFSNLVYFFSRRLFHFIFFLVFLLSFIFLNLNIFCFYLHLFDLFFFIDILFPHFFFSLNSYFLLFYTLQSPFRAIVNKLFE